jgi:hypothetical protein
MSLMKRRTLTGKQKAAARANGSRSQGPSTCEGRQNIRAANLRHGLYSQAEQVVIESLGEDPARFEGLRRGIFDSFPLASVTHRSLVDKLQAALWRLERIERRQEELSIERDMALRDWDVPLEQTRAFNPALASRLMSIEAVTSREVCRLCNEFFELEQEERNRPLPGLPQNVMKTKGGQIEADENLAEDPATHLPSGIGASERGRLDRGKRDFEAQKTSYAGITPECIENKA